jgi:hypothetical protein
VRLRALVGGAILCACAGTDPAHAQTVRGELTDVRTGQAVAGVSLSLVGVDWAVAATARTSNVGEFSLSSRTGGSYRIRAEKPGFRRVLSTTFVLGDGDTLVVAIRLTEEVVLLDSVRGGPPPPEVPLRARAFYDRMSSSSFGQFVSREDIAALRPARTTDLLRRVAGLQFGATRGDGFSTRLRGGCMPTFYLDGTRVQLVGITIDDLVRPAEIEGIEIYRSVMEAPPEYQGLNSGCSAILIWTRIGR